MWIFRNRSITANPVPPGIRFGLPMPAGGWSWWELCRTAWRSETVWESWVPEPSRLLPLREGHLFPVFGFTMRWLWFLICFLAPGLHSGWAQSIFEKTAYEEVDFVVQFHGELNTLTSFTRKKRLRGEREGFGLLNSEVVRREVDCSEKQLKEIVPLLEKMADLKKKLLSGYQVNPYSMERRRTANRQLETLLDYQDRLEKKLLSHQLERLTQLYRRGAWQRAGLPLVLAGNLIPLHPPVTPQQAMEIRQFCVKEKKELSLALEDAKQEYLGVVMQSLDKELVKDLDSFFPASIRREAVVFSIEELRIATARESERERPRGRTGKWEVLGAQLFFAVGPFGELVLRGCVWIVVILQLQLGDLEQAGYFGGAR